MGPEQALSAETLFSSPKCNEYRVRRVLEPASAAVWLYVQIMQKLPCLEVSLGSG